MALEKEKHKVTQNEMAWFVNTFVIHNRTCLIMSKHAPHLKTFGHEFVMTFILRVI